MLQDLPELLLDLICGRLSYEDVLTLRSTCKRLKRFVDEKEFTRLNLFVRKYPCHHRLFYTGEPIGYPHSLHSNDLAIFTSPRFRERFANVQKLTICNSKVWGKSIADDEPEFDLDHLNCFKATLRHLEIHQMYRVKGKLNLQELEIAAFHRNGEFELNCPRLRALRIERSEPVLSTATDQLDYLQYANFGDSTGYLCSISSNLRNLSIISLETSGESVQFLDDLRNGWLRLPSLSQIQIRFCDDSDRLNELASSLESLKRDRRTEAIRLSFAGRPIRSPDELRRIASLIGAYDPNGLKPYDLRDSFLLFLNENPELDCLFSAVKWVELGERIELSKEMIKKLENIESAKFKSRFQPSHSTFELFARTCKSLCSWSLSNQALTERLLEMMAEHLLNLERIDIHECDCETLKPLAKFRNLGHVGLDFGPLKDELAFIYENSATLVTINILGKKINKLRTTKVAKVHRIIIDEYYFEFDTLQAMLDKFEKVLFKNEKIVKWLL